MPLTGIFQCCGKISHILQICTYCGDRVCFECIDHEAHACKSCKDKITRK